MLTTSAKKSQAVNSDVFGTCAHCIYVFPKLQKDLFELKKSARKKVARFLSIKIIE